HSNLLKNVFDFLLPKEEVTINIDLHAERISNSIVDLSIYLKNQTTESPLTSYTSLNAIIRNQSSYSSPIILNTTFSSNGFYFNSSFNLPYPSYSPYSIEVNLTIGSDEFSKNTKILYFDPSKIPKIFDLSSVADSITRANGVSTNLIAEMDNPSYGSIEGYLSIYSYSIFNSKKSVNKTLIFTHSVLNDYTHNFDPETSDPSGFALYYINPMNSNYTNPNSPRAVFKIKNRSPEIIKTSSFFNGISFDDTESAGGSSLYSTTQGDTFNFEVDVIDSVIYEDDNSNMRVFVNLFIVSVTSPYLYFIFPHTIEVTELNYQLASDKYEGSFKIPDTMQYSTISGNKSVSTVTNFNTNTNEGYLALLYLTLYDSEGGTDDFAIILLISAKPIDFSLIIIIIVSIVALIAVVSLMIYYARRKRYPRQARPRFQEYYYPTTYDEKEEESSITPRVLPELGPSFYCPFCGEFIKTPKKFCPHCGESLEFTQ
ncbi:MAG: hypothetical protein ACFFDH_23055, partial [Promethearchaeota archaeon]